MCDNSVFMVFSMACVFHAFHRCVCEFCESERIYIAM